MAIVTVPDVETWVKADVPADREPALEAAISAAVSWCQMTAGRRSLEKESAAVTIVLDGMDACGSGNCDLWLPASVRPAWHTGTTDVFTVVDSGVTLSTVLGYSASADISIRGANEDKRINLYRPSGWWGGQQNVAVTCKAGWSTSGTDLPVPTAVKQLVIEAAWLIYLSSERVGKANVSHAGAAVSIENDLSPMSQATLNALRGL